MKVDVFCFSVIATGSRMFGDYRVGYRLRVEIYFQANLVRTSEMLNLKLQAQEVIEARFFPYK